MMVKLATHRVDRTSINFSGLEARQANPADLHNDGSLGRGKRPDRQCAQRDAEQRNDPSGQALMAIKCPVSLGHR